MNLDAAPNASEPIGAVTSLYYAGRFFGALFSNWIGDRCGRKPAIAIGVALALLSAALTAGSVNVAMFIVFRFVSGWGALMVGVLRALISSPRSFWEVDHASHLKTTLPADGLRFFPQSNHWHLCTTLYAQLGFPPETQLQLQAGLWASNLLFTTSCVFYTEKFRRPTMISFGLCLC
jgi:hypothetical protein